MAYSSDIEEELALKQEEDEKRKAEFDEINQLQRMAALQENEQEPDMNRPGQLDAAKEYAKKAADRTIKRYGVKAAGSAAGRYGITAAASSVLSAIGAFLAATVWIWVPILITVVLAVFVLISLTSVCNSSYTDGLDAATAKLVVAAIPGDVCEELQVSFDGGRSGGAGGGGSFWTPSDLVALSGVTVDPQTSDPRVRQCMLSRVQQIFSAAQAEGLQITITSALRASDFPSRHAYGEAVDIALRPVPGQPWGSNQQIAKLVQISRAAGFTSPVGDTVDEYNSPVERTSGGHIHVEFNRISAERSHCGAYANPPAPI